MGTDDGTMRPSAVPEPSLSAPPPRQPMPHPVRLLLMFATVVVGGWILGSLLNSASASTPSAPGIHDISRLGTTVRPLMQPETQPLPLASARVAVPVPHVPVPPVSVPPVSVPPVSLPPAPVPPVSLPNTAPVISAATSVVSSTEQQISLVAQGVSSSTSGLVQQAVRTARTQPSGATRVVASVASPASSSPAPVANALVPQAKVGSVAADGPGRTAFAATSGPALAPSGSVTTPAVAGADSIAPAPSSDPLPPSGPHAPVQPDQLSVGGGVETPVHEPDSAAPHGAAGSFPLTSAAQRPTYQLGDHRDRATRPAVSPD